tara:strand:+ start:570 stop:1070 length:501 start_codon:yes stop_codon:yes gene_type:complete
MDKLITDFSLGLFFWQTLLFVILIFVLKKYAWSPILSAVEEREEGIKSALDSAKKAREEMESLNADNERILTEAKRERDQLLKEARDIKTNIINEAKDQANKDAEKILTSAKEEIKNEKSKALTELKNEVASLSIQMAEKILRSELSDPEKQKQLIEKTIKETHLN